MTQNHYKNIDTWLKSIKNINNKDKWSDNFFIGKHEYIIEEYDHEGQYMIFASITANKTITIKTSDRYSKTWLTDAEIEIGEFDCWRFNWRYYIEEGDLKKLTGTDLDNAIKQIAQTF